MNSVTRRFTFSYGHRLPNHKGGCRNIHGHNGVLEVTITANPLAPTSLNKDGFIIDFSEMKERINEWILRYWDHALLLHEKDPLVNFLVQYSEGPWTPKIVVLPDPPTAEVMVKMAYEDMNKIFPEYDVTRVVLWETEYCRASYPDE